MNKVLTHIGKLFNPYNPDADLIDPRDIAHALGNTCKFAGHTHSFYSVAQHSCIVADLVPKEHRLAALLRNAAVAYCGDIVELTRMPSPCAVTKERIWRTICERFELDFIVHKCVFQAEKTVYATERRDLMQPHPSAWRWYEDVEPLAAKIRPWSPQRARDEYFQRLMDLLHTAHRGRAA